MQENATQSPVEGDVITEEQHLKPDTTMAMVIYALYLASFFLGFTAIVGLAIAYVYRGKGPAWLEAHYRYQIRTFWIGLVYVVVFSVLTLVAIGIPLLLALAVWFIVRCVKGFKGLHEHRAPTNVDSWLF